MVLTYSPTEDYRRDDRDVIPYVLAGKPVTIVCTHRKIAVHGVEWCGWIPFTHRSCQHTSHITHRSQ
ncbi:hypothetical protein [Methanogenium cariaci]|uniref:hypothetical protein n=1 Tax=Methanogenium cariaci TaxID=2197 RepID=UPI001FE180F9|nr:hypothetical protein [Methanogenium cariaci]